MNRTRNAKVGVIGAEVETEYRAVMVAECGRRFRSSPTPNVFILSPGTTAITCLLTRTAMLSRMLPLYVVVAAGLFVGGINGAGDSARQSVEETTRIVVERDQVPLAQKAPTGFTPFGDLHALPASDYTNLGHPNFPKYNVRIKTSHFCDGTVK